MAKDAFAQGKLAFEHNHPMSSCDYPVGSSLRAEWMAGWTEASNVRPQDKRNRGHVRNPIPGEGSQHTQRT